MNVYETDPLTDVRWAEFLMREPRASIFHSPAWLKALHLAYGYEPIVFTTTPPGQELRNGIVFCGVRSWLTGGRMVSLPFSDHCQPLVDDASTFAELLAWVGKSRRNKHWKYVELRPRFSDGPALEAFQSLTKCDDFYLQVLDLRPDLQELFRKFHKSCVQRNIRKAEREGLIYEEGRSEALLQKFYALLVLTRKRHQLPPQPIAWFRILLECLGDSAALRVASKGDRPIASIFTIQYKDSLIYKYGCSDAQFHNLGAMALLFWKAIQDGKRAGATEYDLGRSETGNPGLISFKENWGAESFPLHYYRAWSEQTAHSTSDLRSRVAKSIFARMPDALLTATGKLLYRHIG